MRRAAAWPAVAALVAALLAGCSAAPQRVTGVTGASGTVAGGDGAGTRASGASGTSSGATGPTGPAGVTAELTGSPSATSDPPSTIGAPCTLTVGSQLRERATVTAGGAVTVLAGTLPCAPVGVWVSSFALNEDAAADPTPHFAGRYTGAVALTAQLPAIGSPCSAAAAYFAVDADDATRTAQAAAAALAVRSDLGYWPAGQAASVPGGAILQGRATGVLAAAVTGDPSRCSPGDSVATPVAAVGDCWLAGAEGTPAASSRTTAPGTPRRSGFRTAPCTASHTHEVYWAENVTPQAYVEQTRSQHQSASAWVHKHAQDVCLARRGSLRLADGVARSAVYLEVLWPSSLEYPPPAGLGWSRAQVVCLARWKDGAPSTRRLLEPSR